MFSGQKVEMYGIGLGKILYTLKNWSVLCRTFSMDALVAARQLSPSWSKQHRSQEY